MEKFNHFKDNLLDAMGEKDCTQKQLAEYLCTTQQTVSRWIKGINEPDFDTLMVLCRYFGWTIDAMLGADRKTDADYELYRLKAEYHDKFPNDPEEAFLSTEELRELKEIERRERDRLEQEKLEKIRFYKNILGKDESES